jgi:glucan phosphoethanolaminetransferase (alkaline phosphatase superfamily)
MPRLSALGGRLAAWGPVRAPSPYTVTSLMRLFVSDGASAPVLFRLAGWRTCFVGAQGRWGRYGSVESAIFSACERKVYLDEVLKGGRVYDGQLLPFAAEMMAAGDGRPFALFIHMLGSHFQPEDRVPSGFAEGEGLDGYDRSVRYTDEVLAQLIDMLPPRTELFFISDHGESVDAGLRRWRNQDSDALWSVPVFAYPADADRPTATVAEFVSLWSRRAAGGVRCGVAGGK